MMLQCFTIERISDTHCTFASVKIDDQPLGQLTGLVSLLNSLLLYIPWLHPPTQTEVSK